MSALPVADNRKLELTDDVTDQAGGAVQRHASRHTSQLACIENIYLYIWIKFNFYICMAGKHDLTSRQGSCTYCWSSFKHVAVPMAPRASPASCRTLPGIYQCQHSARGTLVNRVHILSLHAMFVAIRQHLFQSLDGCCILPLS